MVALFTRDLVEHEAAIRRRLGPGARFDVRQVRWSEAELRRLQTRIGDGARWLETVHAVMTAVGVDIKGNVVLLRISSANPAAATMITDHFAAHGKLRIESDGSGAELILRRMPRGTLRVQAVDSRGRPVPDLLLSWTGMCRAPGTWVTSGTGRGRTASAKSKASTRRATRCDWSGQPPTASGSSWARAGSSSHRAASASSGLW